MPYPDDFRADLSGACPSIQCLRSEALDRWASRMVLAVDRIMAARDEIAFQAQRLASPDGAAAEDCEDAERMADQLEIALHRITGGVAS